MSNIWYYKKEWNPFGSNAFFHFEIIVLKACPNINQSDSSTSEFTLAATIIRYCDGLDLALFEKALLKRREFLKGNLTTP